MNYKCPQCDSQLSNDSKFCHHCGYKLISDNEFETLTSTTQESTSSYTSKASYNNTKPIRNKILVVICIILALIVGIIIVSNLNNENETNLTPVSEPASGTILSGREYYNGSEITITAPSNQSCVIKLKTSSGNTRLSFYVRAGKTVTIGVPAEYLYVYFASGKTWYGNEHLFGKNTNYSMDSKICDFKNYTWEYTLTPTSSGNFSQKPIDESEF
ncbi:MAG: zinc-ribbon domain-containing protein [Clostridia bacterium]|nr:zinc-ribbon domain-containing protein [Clostridia bacterium]